MLRIEAAVLACLALVLAVPAPAALARARWPVRAPRAALVLWQAIGLAGGLAILGAGLTLAAADVDDRWLTGVAALPGSLSRLGGLGWAGVALTVVVGVWLVAVTALSTARVVLARRDHRRRLDNVAESWAPDAVLDLVGVHLVDHPHAVAYCVPGLRPRVVVSRGALQALADGEVAAVVAHERAHARARHDLVIQPFVAWRDTFPFLPTASRAVTAVQRLVELLADDAALRSCGSEDLQRAIRRLAVEHRAVSSRGDRRLEVELAARESRLGMPPSPLPAVVRGLVYLAALALVLVPPAILLIS